MKCMHCGADLPEDQLICPRCGREIQIVPDYNPLDDNADCSVKRRHYTDNVASSG